MQQTELTVSQLSPEGYGLAVVERPHPLPPLQVEIAHAVPQDRVLVELHKKFRGVRKGRLLEVIERSPDRVEPVCKHARMCGGCAWQQMSYEAQLREKEKRVQTAFGNAEVQPIVPAKNVFHYRNKMEFTFSENRVGGQFLGLRIAQAGAYAFNVEECYLGLPWFAACVGAVRTWWQESGLHAYYPPKDAGSLRYLTLRGTRTGQKMAVLNVSGRPEFALTRAQLGGFIQAVGPDVSAFVRIHQALKGRATQFFEMHLSGPDHIVEELHLAKGVLSFKISPVSFFQPNTEQAQVLYNTALSMLETVRPKRLYDLYCGTGTLSMAAGAHGVAEETVGVELSPEAVLDAEENMVRNGVKNCRFMQGDVGAVLGQLEVPDAVIVDPPRAGLSEEALGHLVRLKPKVILYISCNPQTQALNVQELIRAGYRLKTLQPVDQFPHTPHIENIAFLER